MTSCALAEQIRASDIVVDADFGATQAAEIFRSLRANMTYDDMAEKLKKHGFKETKASITNKLARESLPAAFFLVCLAAMQLEGVALTDI